MELLVDIKKKLPGFVLDNRFETAGDTIGLLGASGSGKSMTLRCIAGLETPDKGRIVLNRRVLFDSEKGINISCRKRKIGFLFQNYALFPNMTVEENVGFALDGMNKLQRRNMVREKIEMVKLAGLEKRYPYQLSGGQQQRVAIARALAIEPEALLLDEPFSALDDHLRSVLTKQLIDTLDVFRGVALFVTHNMEEAYRICTKLVVLKEGHVEASGHKEDIFQRPPTIATAQLTGCKNFSRARYIAPNQLFAVDWGIKLNIGNTVKENLSHVGIRANYIKFASMDCKDNVFECWPGFISESPFRVTVYLSVGKAEVNGDECHLQWEVSKEKWFEMKAQPLPWRICLDSSKLMAF